MEYVDDNFMVIYILCIIYLGGIDYGNEGTFTC